MPKTIAEIIEYRPKCLICGEKNEIKIHAIKKHGHACQVVYHNIYHDIMICIYDDFKFSLNIKNNKILSGNNGFNKLIRSTVFQIENYCLNCACYDKHYNFSIINMDNYMKNNFDFPLLYLTHSYIDFNLSDDEVIRIETDSFYNSYLHYNDNYVCDFPLNNNLSFEQLKSKIRMALVFN